MYHSGHVPTTENDGDGARTWAIFFHAISPPLYLTIARTSLRHHVISTIVPCTLTIKRSKLGFFFTGFGSIFPIYHNFEYFYTGLLFAILILYSSISSSSMYSNICSSSREPPIGKEGVCRPAAANANLKNQNYRTENWPEYHCSLS